MNSTRWQGVFSALTTKFKADFSLDLDAMAKHLEFQLEAGVHGLIILGSLGENATLDRDEKLQQTEFFIKHVNGRVPLLAGIAESDTPRFSDIRRTCGDRYAIFCGVDDLAFERFSLGAVGWVAGLVVAFPHETVHLYDLMCAQRWAEARLLYEWFLPLLHLDVGPKFVQQIKLVEEITGVGSARVRSPRLSLNEAEARHVRQTVEQALARRPML